MPEYVYSCLCADSEHHQYLCVVYNRRKKLEFELHWYNTGIAKHWREVEAEEVK